MAEAVRIMLNEAMRIERSQVIEADMATRYPKFAEMIALFKRRHPELVSARRPD